MRIGNDLIEVERISKAMERPSFFGRVFTPEETKHIELLTDAFMRAERAAGKFAAKEAVAKALGTGIALGVSFKDIEITNDNLNCPQVKLSGGAQRKFDELGFCEIHVSISHSGGFALATCVMQ